MRIFITGVAGFLGSHLADRLIADGHQVSGCDNFIGGYRDNVPAGVNFFKSDCLDRERMWELLEGVDVVYHAACTAYEGLSVFSPYLVTLNTFQATLSMLSAAIVCKVKRFVFLSSMARYGAQDTLPFTEDMVCRPQDPYGIAKYAAELEIAELCRTHGIEYSIAVPHNIIGPRQKYDDPYRNVASIFINLMLQKRAPAIYGDGEQTRCFSFVDDVVDPLVRMGTLPEAEGEIINVGPDQGEVTINELFKIIAGLTGFKGEPMRLPGRPREVKRASCSAEKARRLLGYEPKTTLEDGLRKMIEWIEKRGMRKFEYHLPLEIENDQTPRTWTDRLY